jgi:N-acetylglutamate synthase-like GNAT family acetyltransferase
MQVVYRQGKLEDLSNLTLAPDMRLTKGSIEFNVIGMGHTFRIAVQENTIICLVALGREANSMTIMYLQISDSHENLGVGSALIRTIAGSHPHFELTVIPFEGTEEFYARLGFEKFGRWEMRSSAEATHD